jgi:hypothetical protein
MRILNFGGLPTSLGEIINMKFYFDQVKHNYDQIKISFHTQLWNEGLHTNAPDWEYKKQLWNKYLFDIGKLFFSEPPYVIESKSARFGGDTTSLVNLLNLKPQKIEMAHLLCKGSPLNLGEEYIVITTKLRQVEKNIFYPHSIELWKTIRKLSSKYKIVILGERTVEMRKEYSSIQSSVFGIYEQLIANLPKERIVDLTVPALGETVSDLKQIQQDCLIMNEAKFVITLGIGGNSCMAHAVANMSIGFRADNSTFADAVFHNKEYPNAIVTKDWSKFIRILEKYL